MIWFFSIETGYQITYDPYGVGKIHFNHFFYQHTTPPGSELSWIHFFLPIFDPSGVRCGVILIFYPFGVRGDANFVFLTIFDPSGVRGADILLFRRHMTPTGLVPFDWIFPCDSTLNFELWTKSREIHWFLTTKCLLIFTNTLIICGENNYFCALN